MTNTIIEYPALIYKAKNNTYIANCITKKIVSYGNSEQTALKNLENILSAENNEFLVKVKPMYGIQLIS